MCAFRLFGGKSASQKKSKKTTRVASQRAKGAKTGAKAIRAVAEAPPAIDLTLDRKGLLKQARALHRHHRLNLMVNPQTAVDDFNRLSDDIDGSAFGPDKAKAFAHMVELAASKKKFHDLMDDDTGRILAAVVLRSMLFGEPYEGG